MKSKMIGFIALPTILIGGCVSQSDYDALSARCDALDTRLGKIENDLYKVEIKQAPRASVQVKENKQISPTNTVSANVLDAKAIAFIKEYVGASFGDDISSYKDDNNTGYASHNTRHVKMVKPFKYFSDAYLSFTSGKLTEVTISAKIDKKYSDDSVTRRFTNACDDLALTLGREKNFNLPKGKLHSYLLNRPTIIVGKEKRTWENHYSLSIYFTNQNLRDKLLAAQKKVGEELPESK